MKLIKIPALLAYFSWIILYLLAEFFLDLPLLYYISFGIFTTYLTVTFFLAIFSRNKSIKNKWHTAFRRHCLYGWIAIVITFNHKIFESIYFIFFMVLLIVIPLISITALFIFRRFSIIETSIDSKDSKITKNSDFTYKVLFKLPRWYKYIPFNLGNVKVRLVYGVDEEYLKEEYFFITTDKEMNLKLEFKYKGIFKAGITSLELTDCLLLASIHKKIDFKEIKVYPKVSPVKFTNTLLKVGEDEARAQIINQGDKFDTREYHSGDSMKRLNWKLFSKQNQLFVKDSELASFIGNRTIIFDNRTLFKNKQQRYVDEKLAEILVSLVNIFVRNNEKYQIYYFEENDTVKKLVLKTKKFDELIDEVSFIRNIESISTKQIVEMKQIIKKNSSHSEAIFITAHHDTLVDFVLKSFTRNSGTKLRLLSVIPDIKEEHYIDTKKHALKAGIQCTEIPLTINLDEYEKELLK